MSQQASSQRTTGGHPQAEPHAPTGPRLRSERAASMRTEFDTAFTRPLTRPGAVREDVLALRIGDEPRLLRLRDIAGVVAHPLLTPVPTPSPALIGIVGNRGAVVAAYDLGVLLGGPPSMPSWLVISADEPTVAVTFEQFEGYQRIERGDAGRDRIVELRSVVESIRGLSRGTHQHLPAEAPDARGDES